VIGTIRALVARDLVLAARVGGSGALSLVFFLMIVALVPFALGPDLNLLSRIGPAILWLSAVLSTLIGLDRLFQADEEDGSLDLMTGAPVPLECVVLAKVTAERRSDPKDVPSLQRTGFQGRGERPAGSRMPCPRGSVGAPQSRSASLRGHSGRGGASCTFSSEAIGRQPNPNTPKKLSGTPTGVAPMSAAQCMNFRALKRPAWSESQKPLTGWRPVT